MMMLLKTDERKKETVKENKRVRNWRGQKNEGIFSEELASLPGQSPSYTDIDASEVLIGSEYLLDGEASLIRCQKRLKKYLMKKAANAGQTNGILWSNGKKHYRKSQNEITCESSSSFLLTLSCFRLFLSMLCWPLSMPSVFARKWAMKSLKK